MIAGCEQGGEPVQNAGHDAGVAVTGQKDGAVRFQLSLQVAACLCVQFFHADHDREIAISLYKGVGALCDLADVALVGGATLGRIAEEIPVVILPGEIAGQMSLDPFVKGSPHRPAERIDHSDAEKRLLPVPSLLA